MKKGIKRPNEHYSAIVAVTVAMIVVVIAVLSVKNAVAGIPQIKLTADDIAADDRFGNSVAISRNTAIVGAYRDGDRGRWSGSAYVFIRSEGVWMQQAKLIADDTDTYDEFAYSVAISGDTVVVGAPNDDHGGDYSGSAYIFTRSGGSWTQEAKLTATDAAANDSFGWSVAICRGTVVIGARGSINEEGSDSGAVYIFTRSEDVWTQQAKLTASDGAADDHFGCSVSISGETIAIGAQGDDYIWDSTGSAYVFMRTGSVWTQQAKLTAANATLMANFGGSVSVSEDTIIVGAAEYGVYGNDSSSAYIFIRSRGSWVQQAKLTPADITRDKRFGNSVAISGDTVVVGAFGDDEERDRSGSAYIFKRSGNIWTQQSKLNAFNPAENDRFGCSVSISGWQVIVGALKQDDPEKDSGAVYVFELETGIMDWNLYN